MVLLQQFKNAGLFQPQHLSWLTRPLTRRTSPSFQLWVLNPNKAVSEFRFKTQHMELYLIPDADCLHFEDIIWSAGSKYKQLVDADKWTPVPGSAPLDAELTLPAGYQAAPPQLSLWCFIPTCVRRSPMMWLLPFPLPSRILHLHQKLVLVGAVGVSEVEILSRFQSLATVTAVVKRVNMCRIVPSGTRIGTHLLLVPSMLLPRCIARRDINRMLLCTIDICASDRIIITPQVTTLDRLPRVVLLVLVTIPPLLWVLLEVGEIWMMTSSH